MGEAKGTRKRRLHRTSLFLTTEQVDRLAALQASTGMLMSEAIRRAVDDYLDKRRV